MSSPGHASDASAGEDAEVRTESDADDSTIGSGDASTMVEGIRAMRDGEFATVEELREAEDESQE